MKVRITSFARTDESFLHNLVTRYAFGNTHWKNISFVCDDSYDRLVILTSPNKETLNVGYDYKKAITFLTEPPESPYRIAYPTSMVCPMYLPQPFWPTDFLTRVFNDKEKTELLSAVTSGLSSFSGHRKRLSFLTILDELIDEGLDIWGRDHGNPLFKELRHYQGPIQKKFEALYSYRYHFACENSFHSGYFTEKIIDPILCNCLCFYDGCQNIEDFIDEKAYVKVDMNNMDESIELVIKSIEDDEWEKRIDSIKKQRDRFLYHLNPLNIIWMALEGKDVLKECRL